MHNSTHMKSLILLICASLLTSQLQAAEFDHDQLKFDFIASDGSYWYDCKHEKAPQPHDWVAYCGDYEFHMHIMLIEYQRENESTFEFHYWVDEVAKLKETHTQSTWITVDKNARPKNIIGYLGFSGDAAQLRIGINLQ